MKQRNGMNAVLAALAGVAMLVTAGTAMAQSAQTANVIIVDASEIMRSSLAGQDLTRQIETQTAELEAERDRTGQELQADEQELVRQQGLLSAEAFEERRIALVQKMNQSQNDLRDKARRFQIGIQRAEAEMQRQLNPIYQDLMNKHGANLILDRRLIVMPGPGLDVTNEVVDRLNQELPSIRLEIPAPGAG